jgi:Tfp pilus assembly protein PilZ
MRATRIEPNGGEIWRIEAECDEIDGVDEDSVDGRERRRFPRVALDAQVSVRVPSADTLFESRLRDLSANGVFIRTENTRPIGTGLELSIEVREGDVVVRARGIIVHEVTPDEATESRPAGIGVMFVDVDPDTVIALDDLIARGRPM